MKTKFIKVQVNERLPSEKYRSVFTNVGLAYINEESNWRDENVNDVNPEYFLDEVPDREEEMREMLEEYVLAIENETIIVKENEDNDGWENFGGRFYDKAKQLLNR